jgi:hypothetical protein
VDLSLDPEFQTEFASAMMFPARDVDSCPSEAVDSSGAYHHLPLS